MRRRSLQRPQADLLYCYDKLLETWTRRLGSRHDAEDVAHDAVVRILQANPTTIQNLRAYLHQTARNLSTDAYRRNAIHEFVPFETVEERMTSDGDLDAAIRTAEIVAAIELALTELPLRYQQVFIWQRIGGLTQAEIADRLGVSKKMIQKYMARAVRHLRARMAAFDSD
jgi:RNA polymerase sigma-70 factor (ECF subfamily)